MAGRTRREWRAPPAIGGHYIAMRWNCDRAEFFSDPLGMRTLYLYESAGAILFSTRLSWLARSAGGGEIDLEALGSHWLLSNQLEAASMVRGIGRLPPGGRACCRPGVVDLHGRPWTPGTPPAADAECAAVLGSFLNPELPEGDTLALGLSGGLDSRLLLALLAGGRRPFSTYVLGNDDHPDVRVAKAIARGERLHQIHLRDTVPDAAGLASMLEEYASESCAIEPACSVLKFRHAELHARNLILVDGGLGEIGRRQYLKRLVMMGKGAMQRGRPEEIIPYLRVHRVTMMEPGAAALMRRGALAELEAVWGRMPPVGAIGEENFADLFAIRTRFPNYAGREQSRTDAMVVSYMPFAQPAVVDCLMRLDPSRRRNGRLFATIIRRYRPSLAKLPVVKGGGTCPFRMPSALAWSAMRLKARLGQSWHDPAPCQLLALLEEYVRDIVASRDVREYAPYDYPKIRGMVERYYAGDRTHAHELNWLLAFELWRRSLSGAGSQRRQPV